MSARPGAEERSGEQLDVPALDGSRLAGALRAGIRRLVANQEHLNKINVFPVPDGDTGTNLTLTLTAVLTALQAEAPAGALLDRVAQAAIDGARGNSGAILAQFLVGLGESARDLEELDAVCFSEAVDKGSAFARESLSEPREGTLLTVITDFATAVRSLVLEDGVRDFSVLMPRALQRARVSLEQTRYQLEALRRANVVDAGAQGFVELVQGMSDFLEGVEEPPEVANAVASTAVSEPTAGEMVDVTHRYCTECMIAGTDIDRARLREALATLGGSVVLAGTREKVKLHVHADDPAAVFRIAAQFGSVSERKADDIRKQQSAAHHSRTRGVAIVVDSAADIPEEELDRLGIHTIPMRVHFGDRSYLDKVSMSQEEFYRELATNPHHPKTSQPPPGDFRRAFEFLASHYDTVLSITLTARVSGTHSAAETAASRVQSHGRVVVVDSLNVSLGEGLVATYAAECAAAGYSGDEVIAAVYTIIPRTRTFGLLGRLDFAVRGGRVPSFVRTIAEFLHATPVLTNQRNGKIGPGTVIFGRSRVRTRFAHLVRRRLNGARRYRVAVGHAQAEAEGRLLLEEICAGLPNIHSRYLIPLGTALGAHGGPGTLVAGIQDYAPPVKQDPDASPT